MLFLMDVDTAVTKIVGAIERGKQSYSFPGSWPVLCAPVCSFLSGFTIVSPCGTPIGNANCRSASC
jgi:hypothetical protein